MALSSSGVEQTESVVGLAALEVPHNSNNLVLLEIDQNLTSYKNYIC